MQGLFSSVTCSRAGSSITLRSHRQSARKQPRPHSFYCSTCTLSHFFMHSSSQDNPSPALTTTTSTTTTVYPPSPEIRYRRSIGVTNATTRPACLASADAGTALWARVVFLRMHVFLNCCVGDEMRVGKWELMIG